MIVDILVYRMQAGITSIFGWLLGSKCVLMSRNYIFILC